jgi:APA family basic amino acid/polyamine antiporter
MAAAMVSVLFSYDGYADAVYLAGETRDPGRALPRALFASLVTITGLYLLANVTFLLVLGVEELGRSKFPALAVARAAFGEAGAGVLTAIALVVLLSAINAYFLSGPRIARLLAEEGLAVQLLGRVPASGAPVFSTLWIVGVAIVYATTNSFNELLYYTVPIISATTAAVAVGLLVQRRRAPERPRPFRTPCAWFCVTGQVAISLAFLVSFARYNPRALLVDGAALALGVATYGLLRRRRK